VNAGRAIARIHAVAGSWVRVERVRRVPRGLLLDLSVCQGKRGPIRASWLLACHGVREAHIDDLDGGGLQLSDARHPAARQYTDPIVGVACSPADVSSIIGALFAAHFAAVDDWIPFHRYLGLDVPSPSTLSSRDLRLRGPRFLMTRYARALRRAGVPCKIRSPPTAPGSRVPLRVMHFGNSHIVARAFEMERVATALSNKALQQTKRRRKMSPDGRRH
jgi:hypothetical protein